LKDRIRHVDSSGFGLAGIIGMPVVHSRSPVIHNFWLTARDPRRVPLAVAPERLKDALPGRSHLASRLQDHAAQADGDGPARRVAKPRNASAPSTPSSSNRTALSGFNNDGNGRFRACATPNQIGGLTPAILARRRRIGGAVVVAVEMARADPDR
jgi:shikimate dehydrogenase